MKHIFSRPYIIPGILSTVLLLVAVQHQPYTFYTNMRWIVCLSGIYIAITALQRSIIWVAGVFCIIAVLFNPIVPIHLSRSNWQPIDIIVAVVFILVATIIKSKSHNDIIASTGK